MSKLENDNWYPVAMVERHEMPWPPIPTSASLSYWLGQVIDTRQKYADPAKVRRIIDTAAYCLEEVPKDVAENVLYNMSLPTGSRVKPDEWSGNFNRLAAVLWRPPVDEHEARLALARFVEEQASAA